MRIFKFMNVMGKQRGLLPVPGLRFVDLFVNIHLFSCSALGWREPRRGPPALTPHRVLALLLGGLSCPQAGAPSRRAARSPGGRQSRRTRPS